MRFIKVLILLALFFSAPAIFAQRGNHKGHGHAAKPGRGHGHGRPHRVVVKRSVYRPAKVVVYRPHWRPNYAYNRRWVYFPRYNMYWDNWRNHYVFYNRTVWVSQPAPPEGVSEKELEKEKQKELKEEEDDVDDVYKSNEEHKKPGEKQ